MENRYQISRNIFFNFLGQGTLLILGVITTPFIVHSLGDTSYGIFSVVLATVSYFSILDLGLGVSVIKYISEYNAKNDRQALGKIITTALTAYTILGFIGASIIVLLTPFLIHNFLRIPSDFISIALSVFYISAIGFLINMILTVFNSIPNGLQRMDITNSRNILFGLLNYLGMVTILILGGNLVHIVIWNIFISILATLIFFRIITQLLKNVLIRFSFDKKIFLKLIRFGGFKFLGNVSGQVVFQLDKIIIGFFHPIGLVTFYAVPNLVVQKAFISIFNITNAVFPALSQSHSLNDEQRTKDLYIRMTKFVIFFMFPLMAAIFIFSESVLTLWMGRDFAYVSTSTLKILAISYFFASMSAPGVIVADAFGKPHIPAFFALISAIINVTAALILVPKFGIEGAAWALLINFISQVPIFLIFINKNIVKISSLEVLTKSYIRPIISGIICSIVVISMPKFTHNVLADFSLGLIIFAFFYILMNFFLGTFDKKDKLAAYYFALKISSILKSKNI